MLTLKCYKCGRRVFGPTVRDYRTSGRPPEVLGEMPGYFLETTAPYQRYGGLEEEKN